MDMNKGSELGWGISGFLTLVLIVGIALLGLNIPVTVSSILMGLMIFIGASVIIGIVLFILFLLVTAALENEANRSE